MPKISRYAGALKPAEFDKAVARHELLHRNTLLIDAARAVLVGGASLEHAANAHGFTRQRLFKLTKQLHQDAVPDGWLTGFVTLPPELLAEVRALEERARLQWALERSATLPD